MLEQIHWLGHDAFRIDGPQTIYFDPYRLGETCKHLSNAITAKACWTS